MDMEIDTDDSEFLDGDELQELITGRLRQADVSAPLSESRSLQLFAEPELAKSIDEKVMKDLQEAIADISFETSHEIAKLTSEKLGTPVRLPFINTSIGIATVDSTAQVSRETHDEIGEFLSKKFRSIDLKSEPTSEATVEPTNERKQKSITSANSTNKPTTEQNQISQYQEYLVNPSDMNRDFFHKHSMLSVEELGLSQINLAIIKPRKCINKQNQVEDEVNKQFEDYLHMLPEVVQITYNELHEKLQFTEGIEKYIDEGKDILEKNKFQPSENSSKSNLLYAWLLMEIAKVLEEQVADKVPHRILIIAAVILFHVYDMYTGESKQKTIEERDSIHQCHLKISTVFMLQKIDETFMNTEVRKYWTLYKSLQESEMIQPSINLNFDRKYAEGIIFYYYKHSNFEFTKKSPSYPYLNQPHNVFRSDNYLTRAELPKAALFLIKKLVSGSVNSLLEQPHIWKLQKEIISTVKDKIRVSSPDKYTPIKSNDLKEWKTIEQNLLSLNEKAKSAINMIVSALHLGLGSTLQFYVNFNLFAEYKIRSGSKVKLFTGQKFDSYNEFSKIWNAEVIPYIDGYKLERKTSFEIMYNHRFYNYSETPGGVTFSKKFLYTKLENGCPEDGCPWIALLQLEINESEPMRSQYCIKKLCLTHNHVNEKVRWMEFATVQNALQELEKYLTKENVEDVIGILQKLYTVIESCSETDQVHVNYSYGMQRNEEYKGTQSKFYEIQMKMLQHEGKPVAEKHINNLLLQLISAYSFHLPSTVAIDVNGNNFAEMKITSDGPKGIIFVGQRFNNYDEFLQTYQAEVKPFLNGYKLNLALANKQSINTNPTETFLNVTYKYRKLVKLCFVAGCPWRLVLELWQNYMDMNDGVMVVTELVLTHNHPAKNCEKLRCSSMNALFGFLQPSINETNIHDFIDICEKMNTVIESCSETDQVHVNFSYGMQRNEESQEIHDKFEETRMKILQYKGKPVAEKHIKKLLLMFVGASKSLLPCIIEIHTSKGKLGEVVINGQPYDTLYEKQRFDSYDEFNEIYKKEIAPYCIIVGTSSKIQNLKVGKAITKEIADKFKSYFIRRTCKSCKTWALTYESIINKLNIKKSYCQVTTLNLSHTHPTSKVDDLAKDTFENILNVFTYTVLNIKNFNHIVGVLNELLEIIKNDEDAKIETIYRHGRTNGVDAVRRKGDPETITEPDVKKQCMHNSEQEFKIGIEVYNSFNLETGLNHFIQAEDHTEAKVMQLKAEQFERIIKQLAPMLEGKGRKWQHIKDLIDEALKIDKDNIGINAELFCVRGLANSSLHLKPNAIIDFTKVLEKKPNHTQALKHRGKCYAFNREYNKAVIDFEAAVKSAHGENREKLQRLLDDARSKCET